MSGHHRVFLYGTLCDAELFRIVAGTAFEPERAELPGHAVYWAEDESFPLITGQSGGCAKGVVVRVDDAAKARLDFYELGFGYSLAPVVIDTTNGPDEALVYFPEAGLWPHGPRWSLPDWQRDYGALSREAAREYMLLIETLSPEAAARAFPQVKMRAASRLRAASEPSPAALEPGMSASGVEVATTSQPYTDYFAVREDLLRFPTFSGGQSEEVKRASFLGGDAVTILPYDPVTDLVLIVRQFRHGPFARGDKNPWTLEPAAGRIDPGEAPEETARRELHEETGLACRDLHLAGRYYPSPGAYSEFLYSYVAIADIPEDGNSVGGLKDEAEDIMSHRLPFARLMELVESGAANTGPLILSAYWLAANRKRLREAH